MKRAIVICCIFLGLNFAVLSQSCTDQAKVIAPVLSGEARTIYDVKLAEARELSLKNPNDVEALIWVGRRTAYPGDYKAAINIYTQGTVKFPKDARLYRHRGHRYITLRCFDDAINDFETAAKLIKGKPDEIETDGLPNAKNIPTSTLQSNVWYHLGLAYYLKGDYKQALKAYKEAEKVSTNPDMRVATAHWHYMTLRRLGKTKEAARLIEPFQGKIEIIENDDYLKLIRLYRGEAKAEDLLNEIGGEANSLGNASLGYGLGNWLLYNGKRDEAIKIFRRITEGNQWASFGFIAAEAELKRQKLDS